MASSDVVELRGHHLKPLQYVHKVTREQFFRELSEDPCAEENGQRTSWVPYVNSPEDPFMKIGYDDLRKLLADSSKLIRLIADRPDFICVACPPKKRQICENLINRVGLAFQPPITSSVDISAAREFGLELDVNYTTKEIIHALGLEEHY